MKQVVRQVPVLHQRAFALQDIIEIPANLMPFCSLLHILIIKMMFFRTVQYKQNSQTSAQSDTNATGLINEASNTKFYFIYTIPSLFA